MNERIKELALDAGLLNYVDYAIPRRCFIHDHADLEEVQTFAEFIVRECAQFIFVLDSEPVSHQSAARMLMDHFGVK